MATPAQQALCAQCPAPAPMAGPSLESTCGGGAFLVFMSLLDGFLRAQCDLADPCGRVQPRSGLLDEYDFVVVGGGSAGAAAAGRLSEERDWRVLLVEAGGDEPPGAQVPSMVINYHGTDLDWQYETQPEARACQSFPGKRCQWVRGKVLGGCSVLNGMMYTRGHPRDYDEWQVPGWRYADVLPYFMKSEDNTETRRVGTRYHGVGGPLTVQRFPHRPALADDLLRAGRELGLPVSDDLNGDQITGFSVAQTTSRDGSRVSSARAFLRPARARANLHVLLNATATRVLLDPATRQVRGVEFIRADGQPGSVRVAREVVLSGGAVNSPQLLLLSGIGPAEHLRAVGVPVVQDRRGVGRNLHNHVAFFVPFNMRQENDTFDLDWASAMQYMLNRTGPMASTGLSQVTAILNSRFADPRGDHPDLQFFFAGYLANCARTGEVREVRDAAAPDARRSVLVVPVALHPRSRGRLELASADPLAPPLIFANYLHDDQDARTLVEGVKIALRLGETKVLKEGYGFELDRTPAPGCEQLTFGSDEYWDCAIRSQTGPENHQAGSCRMGLDDDPDAVVNPELKVIGVNGLRVADASVMPTVISGNTNAPAIMIGERVADFIKKDWKRDVGNRFGATDAGGNNNGNNNGYNGYNGHEDGYHNRDHIHFGQMPTAVPPSSFDQTHNHQHGFPHGGHGTTHGTQTPQGTHGTHGTQTPQGTHGTGTYPNTHQPNHGYTYTKPTTPWYTQQPLPPPNNNNNNNNNYAAPKTSRSLPLQPQPWWQRSYDSGDYWG
ncbi:hypothetical protein R5R35_007635 [Gryllus longicercus]|uniref:Glucose-methanol-choline oxidoreductase N-terminal domain-containing protein n=1 Tax=Gryllus longicercus TaxID=2509291 RepID=A0AAN9V1S0_9ORTH